MYPSNEKQEVAGHLVKQFQYTSPTINLRTNFFWVRYRIVFYLFPRALEDTGYLKIKNIILIAHKAKYIYRNNDCENSLG